MQAMPAFRWGEPPWTLPAAVPPAEIPAACEIAVIGGGLAGLSASLHATLRGASSVVLLEAGRIGAGASGRTGGIALEGTAAGPLPGVNDCLSYLQRVTATHGIDCDLQLPGCWELRHEDASLASVRGEPTTIPRPATPPASGGSVAEATGSAPRNVEMRVCSGAARDPSAGRFAWQDGDRWLRPVQRVAGGTIDPGALLAGLAQAAARAGVRLCENAAVQHIAFGDVLQLAVGERLVRARHAVIALNAYTEALLPLPEPSPLRSALTLAVCTAPVGDSVLSAIGLDPPLPFYTQDLPYLWGRTLPDTRVIFGAGLVHGSPRELAELDVGGPALRPLFERLESRIRHLHPRLQTATVAQRWVGPIAFTATRTPILSRLPEHPNVIVIAGCAGHGIALSVRLGALAAAAVCANEPLPAWGALPSP
jgi:gamma-glutamylputrescine oxidase